MKSVSFLAIVWGTCCTKGLRMDMACNGLYSLKECNEGDTNVNSNTDGASSDTSSLSSGETSTKSKTQSDDVAVLDQMPTSRDFQTYDCVQTYDPPYDTASRMDDLQKERTSRIVPDILLGSLSGPKKKKTDEQIKEERKMAAALKKFQLSHMPRKVEKNADYYRRLDRLSDKPRTLCDYMEEMQKHRKSAITFEALNGCIKSGPCPPVRQVKILNVPPAQKSVSEKPIPKRRSTNTRFSCFAWLKR